MTVIKDTIMCSAIFIIFEWDSSSVTSAHSRDGKSEVVSWSSCEVKYELFLLLRTLSHLYPDEPVEVNGCRKIKVSCVRVDRQGKWQVRPLPAFCRGKEPKTTNKDFMLVRYMTDVQCCEQRPLPAEDDAATIWTVTVIHHFLKCSTSFSSTVNLLSGL